MFSGGLLQIFKVADINMNWCFYNRLKGELDMIRNNKNKIPNVPQMVRWCYRKRRCLPASIQWKKEAPSHPSSQCTGRDNSIYSFIYCWAGNMVMVILLIDGCSPCGHRSLLRQFIRHWSSTFLVIFDKFGCGYNLYDHCERSNNGCNCLWQYKNVVFGS